MTTPRKKNAYAGSGALNAIDGEQAGDTSKSWPRQHPRPTGDSPITAVGDTTCSSRAEAGLNSRPWRNNDSLPRVKSQGATVSAISGSKEGDSFHSARSGTSLQQQKIGSRFKQSIQHSKSHSISSNAMGTLDGTGSGAPLLQEAAYNSNILQKSLRILERALSEDNAGNEQNTGILGTANKSGSGPDDDTPASKLAISRREALLCHRALLSALEPSVNDVKHRVHALPEDVRSYLLTEYADSPQFRRLESAHSMRSVESAGRSSSVSGGRSGSPSVGHLDELLFEEAAATGGLRGLSFGLKLGAGTSDLGTSPQRISYAQQQLQQLRVQQQEVGNGSLKEANHSSLDSDHEDIGEEALVGEGDADFFRVPSTQSSKEEEIRESKDEEARRRRQSSESQDITKDPRVIGTLYTNMEAFQDEYRKRLLSAEVKGIGAAAVAAATLASSAPSSPSKSKSATGDVGSAASLRPTAHVFAPPSSDGGSGVRPKLARTLSSPPSSPRRSSAYLFDSPRPVTVPTKFGDGDEDEALDPDNAVGEGGDDDSLSSYDNDSDIDTSKYMDQIDTQSVGSKGSGGVMGRLLHKRSGSMSPIRFPFSLKRTIKYAVRQISEASEAHLQKTKLTRTPSALAMGDLIEEAEEDELIDLLSKVDDWEDFNVFAVARFSWCGPVVVVGFAIFERNGFFDLLNIDPMSCRTYLIHLQSRYLDNPYHNALHAADVAQSLAFMFGRGGLGRYATVLMRFASLFAALAHDVGHPGVTNAFLVKSWHPLAIRYNDRSPLEMMHASVAFELLGKPGADLIESLTYEDKVAFRKAVISLILATDNNEHDIILNRVEKISQALQSTASSGKEIMVSDLEQMHVLEASLHAADISSSGKPWNIYQQWTERLCVEFRNQGDLEKDRGLPVLPFMDRSIPLPIARFQSGFISAIVLPIYESLDQIADLDFSVPLNRIQRNLKRWTQVAEKEDEACRRDASTPVMAKIASRQRAVKKAARRLLMSNRASRNASRKPPAWSSPAASSYLSSFESYGSSASARNAKDGDEQPLYHPGCEKCSACDCRRPSDAPVIDTAATVVDPVSVYGIPRIYHRFNQDEKRLRSASSEGLPSYIPGSTTVAEKVASAAANAIFPPGAFSPYTDASPLEREQAPSKTL